jgi:hypothetical protein
MKITINILPIIGSAVAFYVAYAISIGSAQKVVHFSGAANEAATMLVSFMLGAGLLICSFEKFNK